MAESLQYYFTHQLPKTSFEQEWSRYQGLPLLNEVIASATEAVSAIEQFEQLPERNQKLLLDMAGFIVTSANHMVNSGNSSAQENYWGLYVVGSRARGEARPDSDLDLLSVGTFYSAQGFLWGSTDIEPVFKDFEVDEPDELPSEYNTGDVDRKYLLRATPHNEGVLPVDLSVVDLTFTRYTLGEFKDTLDVDEAGAALPRVPLVEVTVAAGR